MHAASSSLWWGSLETSVLFADGGTDVLGDATILKRVELHREKTLFQTLLLKFVHQGSLLGTSASLLVTSALLVVTRSYAQQFRRSILACSWVWMAVCLCLQAYIIAQMLMGRTYMEGSEFGVSNP